MNRQAAIELGDDDILDEPPVTHGSAIVAVVSPEGADASGLILDVSAPVEVWSSESLARRLLAVADIVGVATALLVLSRSGFAAAALVTLVSVPALLVVFKVAGLYNRDELGLGYSTLDEAPLLLQVTGVLSLGIAIVQALFVSGGLSGMRTAALWALSFLMVLAGRIVARSAARQIIPPERCLVVGDVQDAARIGDRIADSRARATIVDCLALKSDDIFSRRAAETIRGVVRDLRIHRIIISPVAVDAEGTFELIRMTRAIGVRVSVLPGPLEVIGSRAVFEQVGGMTMLGVPRFGLCRSSRLLKRALDSAGATVGFLLISPVFAAIALAIKLDSKGPILFRQVRVGRDGQPFSILKFRTMVADAEARKEELRSLSIAGSGLFKIANDPRVTRVGRLLRSTSLDELPQLFNVMRGEMSLVGPRPLVTDEDAQVLGLDRSRLRLKPGMTGPWQLLEARVPLQEMVAIDYFYASSWSLWLDLKIMLRTIGHIMHRGNV